MNTDKIKSKIDKIEPRNRKLKKVNWTIPEEDIELLQRLKEQLGNKSVSQTVTEIIESFFNSL